MGVVYRATDLSLRAPGRAEADRAGAGRGRAIPAPVPEGAAARRLARPPERDPDLRGRRARRPALPRDALRAGRRPQDRARAASDALVAGARAARSSAQIAGALDAAHRRGLVHRDVKPANVLLDEDEHAYLTDFGITKQARRRVDRHRAASVGTLDYLAPEQIRGEPVDGRSDQLRARVRAVRVPGRRAAVPPRDRGRDAVGAPAGGAAAAGRPPGARPGAAQGARQGEGRRATARAPS